MEKNVYQNELNQVRYTAEGKAALKTALLTQSAFHSSRRRCGWGRRSLAGVLAAVLLIGTATAVAAPLWEAYFGSLSANERDLMEELSGELPPPVTCGGTTMKPLAAFGADGVFYLMLEIQTPEGTMLPLLDGEDACYTLMDGKNLENRIEGLKNVLDRHDTQIFSIVGTCVMIGCIAQFMAGQMVNGIPYVVAGVAGFCIMLAFLKIADKKPKFGEFALGLAMLAAIFIAQVVKNMGV